MAQSAGAVEYTDCIFADGYDSPNECPRYDTKLSDDGTPVMLWGMQCTSLSPSPPSLLWPGVIAVDNVLSMGQRELNCTHAKLNCLK